MNHSQQCHQARNVHPLFIYVGINSDKNYLWHSYVISAYNSHQCG